MNLVEETNRKIQPIAFTDKALKSLITESVLSQYIEDGGDRISIIGIDNENKKIKFESQKFRISSAQVTDLIKCLNKTEAEFCKVVINNETVVFYSEFTNGNWVVMVGDNISFIEGVIEKIWYSLYEYD